MEWLKMLDNFPVGLTFGMFATLIAVSLLLRATAA